jgi:hypothetical protein
MPRFFVLALFAAAACGSRHDDSRAQPAGSAAEPTSPAGSASGSSAVNPCGYATAEEVGAAIGLPIVVTEQVSPDQCAYYPQPKPSNALYVRVSDGSPYAAMKQTMRNTEPVAGLGDDAMWAKPQLVVHAGSKMVSIQVMDVRWKAGDSKAVAVEVAQKVVPRL